MKFKSLLSTKQIHSICYIILGIFFLLTQPKEAYFILRFFAILLIGVSLLSFFEEIIRRHKIIMPFKTNNFDSKGEESIAEYFKRKNIIYILHPQIKVPKQLWVFTLPFININMEPDFFLPEFNVYVEYWGMIDNKEYKTNQYDRKKKLYGDNDIDFISLYPQNLDNLDFAFTSKLLDIIKKRQGDIRNYR